MNFANLAINTISCSKWKLLQLVMQTVVDLQLFHVLKHTITENKYKFAQVVQATNVRMFEQLFFVLARVHKR